MKKVSLAGLAVNAPTPVTTPEANGRARSEIRMVPSLQTSELSSDQASKKDGRIQVNFRMSKDGYKELRRMALDEDTTVNDLMLQAINQLRQQKGLKQLSG